MNRNNKHSIPFPHGLIASALLLCFVSFQALVTWSSYNDDMYVTVVNLVDIDFEKESKEEVDKEGEKLLTLFNHAMSGHTEWCRLNRTNIQNHYTMPHLQVYSPPPEQLV